MLRRTKDANFRRHTGFKRVFSIFLVSYLIMLILPAAGILYLYHQVTQMSERNCARDAITAITDVSTSLRTHLSWMDATAARFILDTELANMIDAEPLQYGDKRVSDFNAFSRHLNDRIGVYKTDFLGYRMIFQDSELIFYDNVIAHGLERVFNSTLHYENMTYEEWYEAVFASDQKAILPASNIHLVNSNIRALTYNFPIIKQTAQGSKKAVLQFFLPETDLIPEQFNLLSTVYLLDASGEILSSIGANADFPLPVSALQETTGWLRQDGGLLAYTEVTSGIRLAVLIPEAVAFHDVIALRRPLIAIFLLSAIAEGVMCWYLARRNARPIETLASNVNQMLNTPRRVNELEYLRQSIIQLQQDRQTAQQAVTRNKQIETALLLNRLLHNRIDDSEEILQSADNVGIDLRARAYCVAVVSLPKDAEPAPGTSFPEPPAETRTIISMERRSMLIIVYLSEADNTQLLTDRILEHLQQMSSILPQGTKIGLGRSCGALEDVTFSFNQATFCLQADTALKGIIQFDQIGPSMNSIHFPLEQQQRILNAVKHSNIAVIDQEFDSLIHENTAKRHLSSMLKRTLLFSVEALLLMAAEDAAQEESPSDYLRSIPQSNDFRTDLETLRGEFKMLATKAGERYSQQAACQRLEMEAYLEAHYSDSMLTIGSMANHFGFSESYFSVLFKEQLGEPYSSYLEKLRLNKAGELLRSTDSAIEEVSLLVGYNNSTTFRRAFKRVKGLSPQQYRNQETT